MGDQEGTLKYEYDDLTMKTKFVLTRFGGTFGTLRFDETVFFKFSLGFAPYWDCKPTNAIKADSLGVYITERILILSTIEKNHLKCDVLCGSVVNGSRQPIVYSFVLD